jgi:murein DD-endopeptidase MepM/ murein hydrolase activator NlpD
MTPRTIAKRPLDERSPIADVGAKKRHAVIGAFTALVALVAMVVVLDGLWNASRAHTPAVDSVAYLSMPVEDTYVTSPYGMRMHPILHTWLLHDGLDLHAPCGTPIYAAAPGRVVSAGYQTRYGNQLKINHGNVQGVDLATSYNHLSSYAARVGQHVRRGQLIAYAGSTGLATACHLHFMVYADGVPVDPVTWL